VATPQGYEEVPDPQLGRKPPPGYEEVAAPTEKPAPKATFLSNIGLTEGPDVPITGGKKFLGGEYEPTLNGVQSVGRGLRGAAEGAYNMVRHPIDTAKGLAAVPGQAAQVPAAIHDINQSPDPAGTYAKVAQDTAGQGAGQALLGIGTEGLIKAAPSALSATKAAVRGTVKGANAVLSKAPGTVGAAVGGAVGHATGIPYAGEAGAVVGAGLGRELLPRVRIPGENLGVPKPPPVYPGAPLPENPGVFPGAPLPEAPPPAVLQAQPLATGGRAAPEPSDVLGQAPIKPQTAPVYPGAPNPLPPPVEVTQAAPLAQGGKAVTQPSEALGKIPVPAQANATPPAVTPKYATPAGYSKIEELVNEGTGGKPLIPNVPIKNQPAAQAVAGGGVPEGFTPVKSSALKAYHYDPAKQEFTAITNSGSTHIYGEVSPDQVSAFEKAASKGTAWKTLRDNSTPLGKVVNGQRVPYKPPQSIRSATPASEAPDLTELLKKSVAQAKARK